jgi:hypothetical protein
MQALVSFNRRAVKISWKRRTQGGIQVAGGRALEGLGWGHGAVLSA